jgi:nitrate reductase (cytochrome), electron transfer subunit
MKYSAILVGIVAVFATACATSQTGPVADNEIGLSKTSVFEDPSPSVFDYPKTEPSAATALPRAWDSAPPQIPHKVDAYVPITTNKNMCVACHDKPGLIGKKTKGIPTAMPESHYDTVEGKLVRNNGRHICTQCHAPQASVADLVGNTFKTDQ